MHDYKPAPPIFQMTMKGENSCLYLGKYGMLQECTQMLSSDDCETGLAEKVSNLWLMLLHQPTHALNNCNNCKKMHGMNNIKFVING